MGISIDRGNGATYAPGDYIRLCYTVSRPMYIQIVDYPTSGGAETILAGNDDGTGGCIDGTVEPPAGQETITIYGEEGSQASVTFSIAQSTRTVTVEVILCPPGYACIQMVRTGSIALGNGSETYYESQYWEGTNSFTVQFYNVPVGEYYANVWEGESYRCGVNSTANYVTIHCYGDGPD